MKAGFPMILFLLFQLPVVLFAESADTSRVGIIANGDVKTAISSQSSSAPASGMAGITYKAPDWGFYLVYNIASSGGAISGGKIGTFGSALAVIQPSSLKSITLVSHYEFSNHWGLNVEANGSVTDWIQTSLLDTARGVSELGGSVRLAWIPLNAVFYENAVKVSIEGGYTCRALTGGILDNPGEIASFLGNGANWYNGLELAVNLRINAFEFEASIPMYWVFNSNRNVPGLTDSPLEITFTVSDDVFLLPVPTK